MCEKNCFYYIISIFMRIYKYFKLLLFCVGYKVYNFIAFYDQNKETVPQFENNYPRGRSTQVTASILNYIGLSDSRILLCFRF